MIRILKRYVQLAALGAVLVLIAGASPAAAAQGSSTSPGEGDFVFTPTGTGLCRLIDGTYAGTYTGTISDNAGTELYEGVLTANFTFTAYGNPAGTFENSNCTDPGPGDIEALTLRGYNDTSGGGDIVECDFSDGTGETFERVGQNWVAKATTEGGSSADGCDVGSVSADPTELTLTGVLEPTEPVGECAPGPDLGPCKSNGDVFVANDPADTPV